MTLPLHGFQDWQNPLHTADLQTDVLSTNINAGAAFTSAVFDMRGYQSMSLMMSAISNVSPPTGFGNMCYQIQWWANAAGTQIVYEERYSIFPQGAGGAFASSRGRAMHRGPVLGPYMSITIANAGPDQIGAAYRVLGNTKPVYARTYINTDINGQSFLDDDEGAFSYSAVGVAVAATVNFIVPMRKGLLNVEFIATVGPWTISFTTPNGTIIYFDNALAAGNTIAQFVTPNSALKLAAFNGGGGVANIQALLSSEQRNW